MGEGEGVAVRMEGERDGREKSLLFKGRKNLFWRLTSRCIVRIERETQAGLVEVEVW